MHLCRKICCQDFCIFFANISKAKKAETATFLTFLMHDRVCDNYTYILLNYMLYFIFHIMFLCFVFIAASLRSKFIHLQLRGDCGAQVLSQQLQEGNLSLSFEASAVVDIVIFCLKTSVVLNLLKEISRSQDLYFRSTNYIFPIVINRKFVLNAKGY